MKSSYSYPMMKPPRSSQSREAIIFYMSNFFCIRYSFLQGLSHHLYPLLPSFLTSYRK